MLRPVRLIILVALAFVTGILWERQAASDRCAGLGGLTRNGLCMEHPE